MREPTHRKRRGFRLQVHRRHDSILEDPALDEILAGACQYSANLRRRVPLVSTWRLESGPQLHVKYWVPRKAHHRLHLIARPSKIEREANQYIRYERAGLPVADYVFSAVRRLGGRRGLYLAGALATRTIEGARDLRALQQAGAAPWKKPGRDHTDGVLQHVADLLARTHRAGLVHGDFMLKNILYCPGRPAQPYCLIDLSSGWPMRGGVDDRAGRARDLVRFICSLGRSGLSRPAARSFLESYSRAWDTTAPVRRATEDLFRLCMNAPDRKAAEAARLLDLDPQRPSTLYLPNEAPQNDRREEDFGLRADLQRGKQHRPVPAKPEVGR